MVKELLPSLDQLAVLYNPTDPNKRIEFEQIKDIARRVAVNAQAYEVTNTEAIEPAFELDGVTTSSGRNSTRRSIHDFSSKEARRVGAGPQGGAGFWLQGVR